MTKYENNNNNFSDSKYFYSENVQKTNVIKKHLNHSVLSNTPKYTNPDVGFTTNKSLQKKQYTNKKLSSESSSEKYKVIENDVIRKRSNDFEKAGGSWWEKIFGVLKNTAEEKEIARLAAEYRLLQSQKSAGNTIFDSPKTPDIAQNQATRRQNAGYMALNDIISRGDIEEANNLWSRGAAATMSDRLARRQQYGSKVATKQNEWEDSIFADYGGYDGSIYPMLPTNALASTNPKAHSYLMDQRIENGRDMAAPVSFTEATDLVEKFALKEKSVKPTFIQSQISIGAKPRSKTVGAKEQTYDITDSPDGLSAAERAFLQEYTDFDIDDKGLPYTFLAAKKILPDSATGKGMIKEFEIDPDFKHSQLGDYVDFLTRKKKLAESAPPVTTARSSSTSTTPIAEMSTDYQGRRRTPEDWESFPAETFSRPNRSYAIVPYGSSGIGGQRQPKTSSKTEYSEGAASSWFPPRKYEITSSKPNTLARYETPVIDVYEGDWSKPRSGKTKTPKPPKAPKAPSKPFSTAQRIGLAAVLGIAGKLTYDQATKPKTVIPDIKEPTGEYRMYGQPQGKDLTIDYKLPKAKPGFPSRDYARILQEGIYGEGQTPQLDEFGNYMYVRSPKPFAPNESKIDEKGNRKGLTARGREEMWRFGSDLADPTRSGKTSNSKWWAGKYTSIPNDLTNPKNR